jgi:hypothetical protein
LITAVQTALESEMEFDPLVFIEGVNVLDPLDIPVAVAVLVLLFGGLPLAVFGLLIERQWVDVPLQQRRYVRVPYAVLTFQIVSMGLSGLCLAVMGLAFLPGLSEVLVRARRADSGEHRRDSRVAAAPVVGRADPFDAAQSRVANYGISPSPFSRVSSV